MHRYDIDVVERALAGEVLHEKRVDRRHAAEHAHDVRICFADRARRKARHLGEFVPTRIDLWIPMGFVVGLVPDHRRFDHGALPFGGYTAASGGCGPQRQIYTSSSGWASMTKPALRSMASAAARFGTNQLVGSWA